MVRILLLLLALSQFPSSILCCTVHVSAPEVSLSELHGGCTVHKSRHPDCVAAEHRFCNRLQYFSSKPSHVIGVSREVGGEAIGLSCIPAVSYGDVSVAHLKHHFHGGCEIYKSQHRDCLAAIHRYCKNKHGNSYAGMSQEVGHGVFGVGCFRSTRKEHVSWDTLRYYHYYCYHSDSANCYSAASRWCASLGWTGGITQEVNSAGITVACYQADFKGDAFISRTPTFYQRSRTSSRVCDLSFDLHSATIAVKPEIFKQQIYDNRGSNVPLQGTFKVSKTVTSTSEFSFSTTLTISASASVTFGIPKFGIGGSFSFDTSRSTTQGIKEMKTKSKTHTLTSSYNVPAGKGIVKKAIFSRGTANVPFTARAVTDLGSVKILSGIYTDINAYDFHVTQQNL